MNKFIFCCTMMIGLGVAMCHAQTASWTPEDVVMQEQVSDVSFSPDGKKVVWVKRRPDKKKDAFVSDLWLTYLERKDKKGQPLQVQLTRSKDSDRNPVFSADGETVYFLSSRSKGKNLWAMSLLGGAPYVVDSFEVSISSLKRWQDDQLVFVASEGKSLYEQELKKKKDDVVVVEDTAHFKATRVFSFDLSTKKQKRLTDNRYPIGGYAVSRDGKWMVTQHIRSPHYGADGKPAPTYYIWNLVAGTKEQILESGWQTLGSFAFTDDSEGFYFTAEQSSDPEWQGAGISLLYHFDLSANTPTQVPLDSDWGLSRGIKVHGNDVWVSLAKGPFNELAFFQKQNKSWKKWAIEAGELNNHIQLLALTEDGQQAAFSYSTASEPSQFMTGEVVQEKNINLEKGLLFASTNKHLSKKKLARSEVIRWTGARNDEITGILYYPTNYEEGRSYPLMLSIHGGPSGVDTDRWQDRWSTYPHLLAEKGMFVLKPNYHGSSNHGQAFVESIKKHYYELELPDILAGVDKLVKEGKVDEDSLGVMGWSNGAILATMLSVEHPDKFKVVCAGAGDVNWTSDFGTCRFGVTFDQSYFGGAPWDNVGGKVFNEAYVLKSPLFEMEKVKAPTIIFHGSEDRAVPRDQGWEYYRALQQIGQTPVRFLWFPNQKHGLAKLTHQLRKMKEEIVWIDRYLFGKEKPRNEEVLKKGSPLLAMRSKEKMSRNNGYWGVRKGKYLLPQVAALKEDSVSMGCYEVTQAQYAAFDRSYSFAPAEGNHPVAGISLEKAQAYVQWLSKVTGESYRLPNVQEAKALHILAQKAGKKENTLRYWAGYDLTLDEVPSLQAELGKLTCTITQAVGRFVPVKVGEAEVYDLGGNVAEYFEEDERSGTYGYSAWDWVDEAANKAPVSQRYIGFRVVKE